MFTQFFKVTAEACGLSEQTVRCICKEGKDSLNNENLEQQQALRSSLRVRHINVRNH